MAVFGATPSVVTALATGCVTSVSAYVLSRFKLFVAAARGWIAGFLVILLLVGVLAVVH